MKDSYNYNFTINTVVIAIMMFIMSIAVMGKTLAGENILYKIDDMLIITIGLIMVVWYLYKDNKYTNSLIPAYGITGTFVVTLITLIIEAGSESEFDELITLPAISILMIITYYYHFKTKSTIEDARSC
jgi:hypothetical protein